MIEHMHIPVIDIFAGPGGLSEGFSSYVNKSGESCFSIKLSIEKDEHAHRTLRLRSFFRHFTLNNVPDDYYRFIRGEISESQLYERYPNEAELSLQQAWKAELGVIEENEIDKRIKEALNGNKDWVLIGGPPCQAYSVIGRSRYSKIWREQPEIKDRDKRHYLYLEYLRILAVHQPPVFLLENVRGLLSSNVSTGRIAKKIFNDLRRPYKVIALDDYLVKNGYHLFSVTKKPRAYSFTHEPEFSPEDFIVKSEEYGIPQARHRIIILGIRDDINVQPKLLEKHKNTVTVNEVIRDLPKIRSGLSKGYDSVQEWQKAIKQIDSEKILTDPIVSEKLKNEIKEQLNNLSNDLGRGSESINLGYSPISKMLKEWYVDQRLKGVINHSSRGHIKEDLLRYFYCTCFASIFNRSPTLYDFPTALLPEHRNAVTIDSVTPFVDRFRVQLSNKPSTTITSHISKDGHYFIHPDPMQCRSFTVREAARLQTFPDNYYFMGPRTSQYQQVGNAVPPLLAIKLAEQVFDIIKEYHDKPYNKDRISKLHRSWNMSQIRSKDTKPETIVRSILHRMGYRFRLHRKDLPGIPDIVLAKYKTVIFVHGCFWHRHIGCKYAYTPSSRIEFWETKFKKNVERDNEVVKKLKELDWNIIIIWECETSNDTSLKGILKSKLAEIEKNR